MSKCTKCGKALENDSLFCTGCGATVEADWSEESKGEEKQDKKLKKTIAAAKSRIVKDGKSSVISFVIKKAVGYILTAILSAIFVFFAQNAFEENFEDYYYDVLLKHKDDFEEVTQYVLEAPVSGDFEKVKQDFIEKDIGKKSEQLFKDAASYSSDDKEINRLHSQFTDVCEDIYILSTKIYAASEYQQNADDFYVEYIASLLEIKTKAEMFIETREDLCEKYGIEISELGVVQ